MLLSARMDKFALKGRKISSDLLLLCEFIVTDYALSFKPLEQILFQIAPFFSFQRKNKPSIQAKRFAFAENSASPFTHFFHGSGVGEGSIVGVAVGTGVTVGSTRGI